MVGAMKAAEIKRELISLKVDTGSLFEKSELIERLIIERLNAAQEDDDDDDV